MFTGALTQLHVFGSSPADLFVNRYIDALQEGLVLTVSQPVTALLPSNERKFVGVFGIDIPGKDFQISVNADLVSCFYITVYLSVSFLITFATCPSFYYALGLALKLYF